MGPEANTKFMQPIAPDTILQQRYRLMSLIGEGGFGRTYLATDQSRFGEQCAIKELSVASHSRSRLSKAREFFKQEAALLYQLQHPQIPRFWATFEERDRMFLVQDYVPGRTYESLLQERIEKNQTFTEAEVWRFLLQVLPVLGYIHSQGVVHQDISPDNIILRETDLLPVLIDFGVVKQLANRLQGEQTGLAAVHVGKAGYAPMEQINSGYAYPNSDLYSLAVTAVVLLTGRPATDHFNAGHINWAWRNWVNVSDGLANVLGKMITYEPTDRYQSAVEVFQALQSLSVPMDRSEQTKPLTVSQIHPAAGPRTTSVPIADPEQRSPARKVLDVVTQFDVTSIWERPQVFIPLFLVVALLSFGTGLTLMSFFNKSETTVQPSPTPNASTQPLVGSKDGKGHKVIELEAGQTNVQMGRLLMDQEVIYEFYGTQGQELTIEVDNKNLLITVLGSNGLPVDTQAIRTPTWRGQILATGKHTVQIKPLPGVKGESFDYRLLATLALNPGMAKGGNGNSGVQSSAPIINSPASTPVTNPAEVLRKPPPVVTPGVIPSNETIDSGRSNNTSRGSSSFPSQPETSETPEAQTSPAFMPEVTPSSEPSGSVSSSPTASPSANASVSSTPTPAETLLSPR